MGRVIVIAAHLSVGCGIFLLHSLRVDGARGMAAKKSRKGTRGRPRGVVERKKRQRSSEVPLPLTRREVRQPGSALIQLMIRTAADRGLSNREMLTRVGIAKTYFGLLRLGRRPIARLSDESFAKIAEFLGLSRIAVLLLAGRISQSDFSASPRALRHDLRAVLQLMQRDAEYGGLISPAVFAAPPDVQMLIVRLFQDVRGARLLPKGRWSGEAFEQPSGGRYQLHEESGLYSGEASEGSAAVGVRQPMARVSLGRKVR
jgi:hypothetical protein